MKTESPTRGLSGFTLKMIAIIAMTCDHVGTLLFPDIIWLRVIGRLTMPIMAFMIAEGFRHTRDIKRYMLRLFIFALISAVPYYLAFEMPGNVLFTLLLGLVGLWALRQEWAWWMKAVSVILAVMLSILCDWPIVGVLMVIGFGILSDTRSRAWIVTGGIAAISVGMTWITDGIRALVHLGVIGAAPLLMMYNGKRGYDMRYLFYVFYPTHLLLIWLIKTVLMK